MRGTDGTIEYQDDGSLSESAKILTRSIGDLRRDLHVLFVCRTSSLEARFLLLRGEHFCTPLSFGVYSEAQP